MPISELDSILDEVEQAPEPELDSILAEVEGVEPREEPPFVPITPVASEDETGTAVADPTRSLHHGEVALDFATGAASSIPIVSASVRQDSIDFYMEEGLSEEEAIALTDRPLALAKERSPTATGAGELTGAIGGGMLLPGGAAKGATGVGAQLVTSAADQLVKQGELDTDKLGTEALIGGGILGAGKLARGAGAVSDKVGDYLRGKAVSTTQKGVLQPPAAERTEALRQRLMGQTPQVDKAAEELLDRGMMTSKGILPRSREAIAKDLQEAKQAPGVAKSDILNKQPSLTGQALESQFLLKADELEQQALFTAANRLRQEAKNLSNLKEVTPEIVAKTKANFQKLAADTTNPEAKRSLEEVSKVYKTAETELIPKTDLPAFEAAKQEYGRLQSAQNYITEQASKPGLPLPTAAKAVGTFLDHHMPVMVAAGLNHLSKSVKLPGKAASALAEAAERGGPSAVRATHYLLMQKDPEYRKSTETLNNKQAAKKADKEGSGVVYSTED